MYVAVFLWRILNCVSIQSPFASREQVSTHHQQGKKNDPTAPDVCFPPIILLSLSARECLLAGSDSVRVGLKKIEVYKKGLVKEHMRAC